MSDDSIAQAPAACSLKAEGSARDRGGALPLRRRVAPGLPEPRPRATRQPHERGVRRRPARRRQWRRRPGPGRGRLRRPGGARNLARQALGSVAWSGLEEVRHVYSLECTVLRSRVGAAALRPDGTARSSIGQPASGSMKI
ncbi:unnamed protein product [Prorocentrum cordatum]|uniref:Uncharacterized protein n=1 Tax=Prorocentrum cordatum TaxID=2364126 RepID=A0ABN9W0P3_9DINO|nr:unnamed protein product [Polarella glacialis]